MSRKKIIVLLCGVASGFASMAVVAGVPGGMLLVNLAPLPLLLAGLGFGIQAASIAGLVGFMLSVLMGGAVAGGIFAIIDALPAWLVTRHLLSRRTFADGSEGWETLGPAITWLSILAAVALMALTLSLQGEGTGIEEIVSSYLNNTLAVMPTLTEDVRADLTALLMPLFPGTVGVSWVVIIMINTGLAQNMLVRNKGNMRPSPRLGDMILPTWISWLLVGAATLALLGGGQIEYTGRNLTVLLAAPFFFLGLAVVHHVARYVKFPGTLLAFFYFVLLVSGWAPLAVAGIGMIEQWVGLRYRFTGSPNNLGDE